MYLSLKALVQPPTQCVYTATLSLRAPTQARDFPWLFSTCNFTEDRIFNNTTCHLCMHLSAQIGSFSSKNAGCRGPGFLCRGLKGS